MMLNPKVLTAFSKKAGDSISGLSHRIVKRDSDHLPLVMINAMASPMSSWGALPEKITGRTIIMLDPPGIGDTPLTSSPYSADQLAVKISKVVEELGYEKFDLFGYSWGGFIAQHIALDTPDMVHRLVLAGCGPTFSHGYMTQSKSEVMAKAAVALPELMMSYIQAAMKQPDPRGPFYQYLAALNLSVVGRMAGIVQPTLVLAGTRDPISPVAQSRQLVQGIPNATMQTFEAGHFFPTSLPEEVAAAIEGHLDA